MTDPVVLALARGGLVEISTKGRRTGRVHRVWVMLHNLDRRLIVAGKPGRRDWLANLHANPRLIIHFSRGVSADVPALARVVTDWQERRVLMERVMVAGHGFSPERAAREMAFWMTQSPLVVVEAEWPGWV